uniref:Uncharacterized protein n=1 Tax=Fusarium oxysporum (strain Fo5176) TaxID=660025 RepID=A0A0D2Y9N9_FUSOF
MPSKSQIEAELKSLRIRLQMLQINVDTGRREIQAMIKERTELESVMNGGYTQSEKDSVQRRNVQLCMTLRSLSHRQTLRVQELDKGLLLPSSFCDSPYLAVESEGSLDVLMTPCLTPFAATEDKLVKIFVERPVSRLGDGSRATRSASFPINSSSLLKRCARCRMDSCDASESSAKS